MRVERASEGRLPAIDGLRALAVLGVLAHHAFRALPVADAARFAPWLAYVSLQGAHGVDLFFVISGFCLSYPFLRQLRGSKVAALDLPRYIAKRITRIVPPYYTATVLFTLAYFALRAAHIALPEGMPRHGFGLSDALKALFFLDWQTEMINGSFWTLCVEARWYVLFPLALLLWARAPRAFIAVAAASTLAFIFTRLHAIDVGTLLPFLLGIIAADVRARGMHLGKTAFALLPVAIALAVLLAPFVTMPSPLGGETAGNFLQIDPGWQIAAFLVVLCAIDDGLCARALAFPPLVAIGTASYSVYLVHEPIMGFIEAQVALPLALRIGGAFAIALTAGALFWATIERLGSTTRVKRFESQRSIPAIARLLRSLGIPRSLAVHVGEPTQAAPRAEPS